MVILGIDPGLRTTGWGILILKEPRRWEMSAFGTIASHSDEALAVRLGRLAEEMDKIVLTYRPTCASLETIFVNRNAASSLLLGMARGVILGSLGRAQIPVEEFSPNTIKKSLTGQGKAEKAQVAHMVKVLLNLSETLVSDAADALAVALTLAHRF